MAGEFESPDLKEVLNVGFQFSFNSSGAFLNTRVTLRIDLH